MKPDQKMIVALTFITGVFAGAALNILVFAPEFKAAPVEERSSLSVVGEMYGGCDRGGLCPAFRLEGNGSYRYLVDDEVSEGRLPRELVLETMSLLTDHRLVSHAEPVEKDDCDSYTDGIDYRYEIVLEQNRYVLDTCQSSLSYGSELQRAFLKIWEYLEQKEGGGSPGDNLSLGAWVIRQLHNE